MFNKYNVLEQELPKDLISAILDSKESTTRVNRVIYYSKGSSRILYVITRIETQKEIFKLVVYGNETVEDFLEKISKKETLTFSEKNELEKFKLFVNYIREKEKLDSIEIGQKQISLDNMDEFFKSIL